MKIGGSEVRKVEENNDREKLPGPAAAGAGNRVLLVRGQAERELILAKEALERKTEELTNSLVMMRATLESTTDAIVVTDGTAKVTGFNGRYMEMLGVSRETIDSASVQQLREMFSKQFKDPEQFLSKIREIYTSSPPETLMCWSSPMAEFSSDIRNCSRLTIGPWVGFGVFGISPSASGRKKN